MFTTRNIAFFMYIVKFTGVESISKSMVGRALEIGKIYLVHSSEVHQDPESVVQQYIPRDRSPNHMDSYAVSLFPTRVPQPGTQEPARPTNRKEITNQSWRHSCMVRGLEFRSLRFARHVNENHARVQ